jgi:hypothetical protein
MRMSSICLSERLSLKAVVARAAGVEMDTRRNTRTQALILLPSYTSNRTFSSSNWGHRDSCAPFYTEQTVLLFLQGSRDSPCSPPTHETERLVPQTRHRDSCAPLLHEMELLVPQHRHRDSCAPLLLHETERLVNQNWT